MRDGGEGPGGEEPGKKRTLGDGHVHLAMGLVRRAENSTLGLAPGRVDHPLAQGDLEQDPQEHSHEEAAGKLRGHELPTQKDEKDKAQLEDQVGGRELEDDGVHEAGAAAEKRPGHGNRGVRTGGAGCAQAASEHEAFHVRPAKRACHGALRNHRLDHRRQKKAEGEWPEDLPQHEERELQGVQDRVDDEQADLAPDQPLDGVV